RPPNPRRGGLQPGVLLCAHTVGRGSVAPAQRELRSGARSEGLGAQGSRPGPDPRGRTSASTSGVKDKLLEVVADARAHEQELVGLAADVPADPAGRWHAKDHLAHSAWWRDRDGRLIDAVRVGSAPPPAVGSRETEGEDQQNAVIYAMYRDRALADIRDYASSAWQKFTDAVEACSEDDLARPHPYAANEVLWQTALGICYHTGE